MNIGTLELRVSEKNGPYYVATNIDFVGVPEGIAIMQNPKKADHENAADWIIKVLVGRNWKTAGSASWKEGKTTGLKYVNGAISMPGKPKIFLNFYPANVDDAGDAETFDVVYASGGGRSSSPAPAGKGAAPELQDEVPF